MAIWLHPIHCFTAKRAIGALPVKDELLDLFYINARKILAFAIGNNRYA
ncbi:hypothetical protein [Bartonella apihabitans]